MLQARAKQRQFEIDSLHESMFGWWADVCELFSVDMLVIDAVYRYINMLLFGFVDDPSSDFSTAVCFVYSLLKIFMMIVDTLWIKK